MEEYEFMNVKAIEHIMDTMNHGIVYIDSQKKIRVCNRKAKEITGIVVDSKYSHDASTIVEGDIVVIADNKIGDDDGELSVEELEYLNIRNRSIKHGDMIVAVGIYKNSKIEPHYKYIREHELNVPLKIESNYFGFNITAIINTEKKFTTITVNDFVNNMPFFFSVGNIVVIDGKSGDIKFFQAKGYGVRNEEIGNLLRGQRFLGKDTDTEETDVIGKKFSDLFNPSDLVIKINEIIDENEKAITNRIYEINKRPFICNIIPWGEKKGHIGTFLLIQEAENLEKLVDRRNEIIKQLEEQNTDTLQSTHSVPEGSFGNFIGKCGKINEVKYMAYKASQNKFNVIITGESGTGKSIIAREIHRIGNPNAPFVEVNCNAIAPTLFESELFGYVGGAFTGAKSDGKIGFFEAANGGTIFLDEIGEIPLEIQVKLLHVLQNKIIYRVGSSKPIKVDARVIAATNKNLEQEVLNGNFRQDLYYRINVFPISIPPLRERKSDLYIMINQILMKTCEKYGFDNKIFSGEALQKMISYNWPGNVRELENVIERAVTICEGNIIYDEHLSIKSSDTSVTMKEMLSNEEKRIMEYVLMKHNGNKNESMEELDMSRSVFYDKMKKYNLI